MQRRVMRHFVDRYATGIVAVSEAAMNAAWGAGWLADPRCAVVYNGLDVAAFRRPPERSRVREEFGFPTDVPVWIHVGRIDRPKNHHRLLRVFARHKYRGVPDRLLLVGRGTEERVRCLRREIARLGLGDHVMLTGERRDVARLLLASDIMVYPSLREGLPGAVLEACAAGLPVLGSDIAGIQEIARHCTSVRCLPLEGSDVQWVNTAEAMLAISSLRSHDSWRTALADFERGPFSVGRCKRQLCSIWDGSSARGIACAEDLPPQ
jgi:glycosyltransferase involved in cell wall biosynthesis